MKLLVLSQYYDPEPVPKAGQLARAMSARGHDVSVVTGFPNYPNGVLYQPYRLRLRSDEWIDGIPVTRTFEYPYHGKSVFGRLINYWSFAFSSLLGARRARGRDVIYVWHPPLSIGVAAWLFGKIASVPFVYDVQDIWPESAVLSGMMRDGWLTGLMRRLELFVYSRAAHLLVVTEGARQNLIGKGVPAEKISVTPHWVDESAFEEIDEMTRCAMRTELGWRDDFVVLFAGNLGMVQGLDTLIRSADHVPHHSRVRIVLMGDGTDKERLMALAKETGADGRVQFIGRQPADRMPEMMASADALVVHLRRSDLSQYVIPSKTLSYLAAGRPIVMAMKGAAADLVAAAGAGVVIPPDDPSLLGRTLVALENMPAPERDEFGRRGRAYVRRHLSKERVLDLYEDVLCRMAKKAP